MPKRTTEKTVNFSLRLSAELDKKIQDFAASKHWSRNKAIALILEAKLAEG